MIDVAIPDGNNIRFKEVDKLSKYKDLEIEISRTWGGRRELCLWWG